MEQPTTETDLKIGEEIKKQLTSTRKWASFISITAIILLGFFVVFGFSFSFFVKIFMGEEMPFDNNFSYIGFLYLVLALIYFFPFLFLYQFSNHIKKAFQSGRQESLNLAFVKLNSHYNYMGIMLIIMVAIYVLMIVGSLLSFFLAF